MKINQIILSEMATTAGAVATVAKPMGETQKRPTIRGLEPAEKVMSGKSKKKGPYANSLSEGKVKQLSMDLKGGKDGLTDEEFKKKYGKTKAEVRKEMQNKPQKAEPVQEAKLDEEDIIVVPGQGRRLKSGFVPHGKSRVDHEVEMAKSDLIQLMKNTETVMMCIKDKSEEDGLEGWVQEKIIKAADYMNTLAEYLEGKKMQEMTAGTIAGGIAAEGVAEASPEATFNTLKGLKTWQVVIMNNYYRGKYADYSGRYYYVLASSPEEAEKVVLKNADAILQDLLSMKSVNGRKILPRGSALRITADRIGEIRDGTEHGRMSTAGFKKMYSPQGPMMVKLTNGAIADVQGQEQGVAEGAKVDRMVKHITKSEKKLGHSKKEAENIAWATANKRGMLDNKNKKAK